MTGRHIKKKKHVILIVGLLMILLGIFGYFHFHQEDNVDLSRYETIVGTIKSVGDETLLIENNEHQKYLISIAGVIDSNDGLEKGNRIYIYYDGQLDVSNKDIQNVKVKAYKVLD